MNELSGHLYVPTILNRAEGIYNQILEATDLNNTVRNILGIPTVEEAPTTENEDPLSEDFQPCSIEADNFSPDELTFENGLANSYL